MLNHITIMGRLTRDPELRRTGSGIAVASFSLAVDRDFSQRWRRTGNRLHRLCRLASDWRIRLQVFHQGPHGSGVRSSPDP